MKGGSIMSFYIDEKTRRMLMQLEIDWARQTYEAMKLGQTPTHRRSRFICMAIRKACADYPKVKERENMVDFQKAVESYEEYLQTQNPPKGVVFSILPLEQLKEEGFEKVERLKIR